MIKIFSLSSRLSRRAIALICSAPAGVTVIHSIKLSPDEMITILGIDEWT